MLAFVMYIFLFVSLCVFILLSLAIYNLFSKSFQPRNILVFFTVILVLFFINFGLALSSLRTSINRLYQRLEENQTSQQAPSSVPLLDEQEF